MARAVSSTSILLLAGGLEALQQASIIAAAPFMLVMIGLCFSLYKDLSRDQMIVDGREMRREMRRVAAKRRRDRISSR